MAFLTDLSHRLSDIFNQGGNLIQQDVIHPAQQAIFNYGVSHPQQTQQILNAPKQIQQIAPNFINNVATNNFKPITNFVNSVNQKPLSPQMQQVNSFNIQNAVKPLEIQAGQALQNFQTPQFIIKNAVKPAIQQAFPVLKGIDAILGDKTKPLYNELTKIGLDNQVKSAGNTLVRIGQGQFASPGHRIEDIGNVAAVLPVGRIAKLAKTAPEIVQAATKLKQLASPEDINLIKNFASWVDRTGGKGDPIKAGIDVNTVNAIAKDLFGSNIETVTNKQLGNIMDATLKHIGTTKNDFNLGLAVNDIRKGQRVANAGIKLTRRQKSIIDLAKNSPDYTTFAQRYGTQLDAITQKEGYKLAKQDPMGFRGIFDKAHVSQAESYDTTFMYLPKNGKLLDSKMVAKLEKASQVPHSDIYNQVAVEAGIPANVNFDNFVRGKIENGKVNVYYDPQKVLGLQWDGAKKTWVEETNASRLAKIKEAVASIQKQYGLSGDTPLQIGIKSEVKPNTFLGEFSKAKTIDELLGNSRVAQPTTQTAGLYDVKELQAKIDFQKEQDALRRATIGNIPDEAAIRNMASLKKQLAEAQSRVAQQPTIGDMTPVGKTIAGGIKETPMPLTPPKNVGLVNKLFNRTRNIIAQQGPAGQQLAANLQKARDVSETTAGRLVSAMRNVRSLNPQEFTNFVDAAEGNAKAMSPKIEQAVQEWSIVRDSILAQAKKAGVDVGKIEDYFPHHYDPSIFTNKNKYNAAINHLVDSGQAKTQLEAAKILRYAQDVVRNRRQGNLELSRLINLPNYEKTPEALFNYISNATDRIAQVQIFGKQDENALKLINQIAMNGGDALSAREAFDIAVGAKKYGQTATDVSNKLRKFNTVTKLGLGAITNAGQSINTMTVTGALRTLTHAPEAAFSKQAKEFALQTGTTLDTVLQDLKQGSGLEGKTVSKIGAPGFNVVERFNRTLASVAGRDYARGLFSKGDFQTLAKMGIEVKKGQKALTPEQEIQAARNIVERTQFKVDPQDLPGWTSSPLGKLIAQFRTFSYNQTAFMAREVISPALHGNVMPLIRFMSIGIPVGMGIQTTKNILRNRQDEQNPLKRVQQGFGQVGGFGLAQDIITGLSPMNGKYVDQNRLTTMALSSLFGPTAGTVITGYGGLTNAVQGKPANLERFILSQIPLIGPTLQNTILPYKTASGDINRRFNVGIASAAEEQQIAKSGQDLTNYVANQKAKDRITQINSSEKTILDNNGMNFFGWQMGGLTDQTKNEQIAKLEAEKAKLNFQIKSQDPSYTYQKANAEYSLAADRLKRADDFAGWMQKTGDHVKELYLYQQTLDPTVDSIKVTQIQNTIEDLLTQMDKYGGYGGFTKGKAPKKISIGKTSVKYTPLKAIKSSKPKLPKIKVPKTPTYIVSKPQSIPKYKIKGIKVKFSSKPKLT